MLDFRQYTNHSDEITSLYQVSSAARCNSLTPVRRAAACSGVAPAARGPGASAPSRACAGAGCRPRCWPSGCARGAVLVAPLRGACARPCPLRRRAARPRALWCFGRCGGLAFRSAGGRAPRAVAPSLRGARLLALGLLRFASAAGALLLRGRASLRSPPSRAWAAALVAAVAARRARSLAPAARRRLWRRRPAPGRGRRGAPPGPLFPRLSALGACAASFPLRVARRLSPLRGFGLGRPRRSGPRLGALARPPRGVWGLRRCGGAFFAAAAARCCRAPPAAVWLHPRCSSALPSAAASFARCFARRPPRFGFARAARPPCLRLRLPSHADGRATAARPFCAFGAFVVQREGELQGITQSATYCVGYLLDIPYTGEFGKTRIILPNYLWISSIDTAPYFWYALIRI